VIGVVQRNETFGVSGGFKNPGGIVNADDTVGRCMKD
jgi:hypothetical protein